MLDRSHDSARALAVLVASLAVELGLVRAAAQVLQAAAASWSVDISALAVEERVGAALTTGVLVAALAAWTWWCVAVLRAIRLTRRASVARPAPRHGSRWVRAAALALGIGTLATTTAPASAGPTTPAPPTAPGCGPSAALPIDGLALPVLPTVVAEGSAAVREPPREATGLLVERGDSLWSLAERHLGPAAPPATVDRLWRRWYAANSHVVGPDPDLLVPGQRLRIPPAPPNRTTPTSTDRRTDR
jgi:hypothetical protein